MGVYMDYASTTPLIPEVSEWVSDHLDIYGNPSSPHQYGRRCADIITSARHNIADYMGCNPKDLIFTSSASQANSLALTYRAKHICESPIEHSSILEWVKAHEDCISGSRLCVDSSGFVDLDDLERRLRVFDQYNGPREDNCLVVVQWANNEIGTIQDIGSIADLVHKYNGKIFVDATQIFPWLNAMSLQQVIQKIDMLSASAHKCGSLLGCGILYKKPDIKLSPIVYGHQENGLVGGTENWLAIGAFGEAVYYQYTFEDMMITIGNRDYLYNRITDQIKGVRLNGPKINKTFVQPNRLPNNLNIQIGGVRNETLVNLLDSGQIYCSSGSACNAHSLEPSHVLTAIGLHKKHANYSIRLTVDPDFDAGASIIFTNELKCLVDLIRRPKRR